MNEWSRRDIIALLSLIATITGIGITFFQDEIKCATGLSCADNSGFTASPPRRIINQPSETGEKGWGRPDSIPDRVEAEMAAQKLAELKDERDDLDRRIAHMRSLADRSNCSKDWNQGRTCYLEGRLLSRAEFDRELARMKLMIRQIKQ